MKTHPIVATLLLTTFLPAIPLHSATPSRNTARYINDHVEELTGKEVTVDVTHVTHLRRSTVVDGYATFSASTWDDRNRAIGGTITVLVPAAEADKFADKYGSSPDLWGKSARNRDTRSLRATLRVGPGKKLYLDLDGTVTALGSKPAAPAAKQPVFKRRTPPTRLKKNR